MPKRLLLMIPVVLTAMAVSVLVPLPLTAGTHAAPPVAPAPSVSAATTPDRSTPATAAPAPAPTVAACAATLRCDGDGPIVALGDSTTYGYGRGTTLGAYLQGVPLTADGPLVVGSWPWDLQRMLGIPVINDGMSGDTAYTALHPPARGDRYRPTDLQIPALLARHPRLVILSFGSAEAAYGVPIDRAASDLDALLRVFDGIPTVIVGTHVDCSRITVCVAPQPVEYTDAWDAALRALAARHHSGLVTDAFAGLPAAGGMTDSMHPNVRGYALVAARIAAAVRQRLTPPATGG